VQQEQVMLQKVQHYLKEANVSAPGMDQQLIDDAAERLKTVMNSAFNETRSTKFRLSMSSAGKPTCQLLMKRDGAPEESPGAAFRMKMLIGDITELVLGAVIQAAGINVTDSNLKVKIDSDGIKMSGELDLIIDDESVWDVKSCSRWAFDNKWKAKDDVFEAGDDFGYLEQLYGYSEASEKRPGGWFVVNKETGELLIRAAKQDKETMQRYLGNISDNLFKVIDPSTKFERSFTDEEETFRKKPTGNRKLGFACSFCNFKYSCWDGLTYRRSIPSAAKSPKMEYYTHINPESITQYESPVSEGKGKGTPKASSEKGKGASPTT